jgi:predicted RNA polymerase sigma factor
MAAYPDLHEKLTALDIKRVEDHQLAEKQYHEAVSAAWAEWSREHKNGCGGKCHASG